MTGDLVAPRREGLRDQRIALQGPAAGEDRGLRVEFVEQVEDAPGTDTGAVFEGRFDAEVARLRVHRRIDELADPLPFRIAVADAELGPFLVVEDEGDDDAGIVRPLDLGVFPSVAHEVAHIRDLPRGPRRSSRHRPARHRPIRPAPLRSRHGPAA